MQAASLLAIPAAIWLLTCAGRGIPWRQAALHTIMLVAVTPVLAVFLLGMSVLLGIVPAGWDWSAAIISMIVASVGFSAFAGNALQPSAEEKALRTIAAFGKLMTTLAYRGPLPVPGKIETGDQAFVSAFADRGVPGFRSPHFVSVPTRLDKETLFDAAMVAITLTPIGDHTEFARWCALHSLVSDCTITGRKGAWEWEFPCHDDAKKWVQLGQLSSSGKALQKAASRLTWAMWRRRLRKLMGGTGREPRSGPIIPTRR